MARNLRAFPRAQMRDVRSLPPAEVAIASVLAAGLWALQTRSWRRTELHVKNREFFFDHTSKDTTKYDSPRRSIYLPVVRNHMYDVFDLFDYTDATVASGGK